MKWMVLWLMWLSCAVFAAGSDLDPVALQHEASSGLLQKNPIRLQSHGEVDIPFEEASQILTRTDFLEAIQSAYGETLPDGAAPEFVVQQIGDGKYHYTNCHQQETSIEEVCRTLIPAEKAELVIYSEGVRFFGEFQSLCWIEVTPAGRDRTSYSITVYAHPDSTAVRWLARVSPVEAFFKYKTRHLTDLVVEVCGKILERDQRGLVQTIPVKRGES